jgi:hypothetical protein
LERSDRAAGWAGSPIHAASGPLQELIKLRERKNRWRFGAERQSSPIGREPDHAASGPLQELIKLRERKNLRRFGAERQNKRRPASLPAFWLKV